MCFNTWRLYVKGILRDPLQTKDEKKGCESESTSVVTTFDFNRFQALSWIIKRIKTLHSEQSKRISPSSLCLAHDFNLSRDHEMNDYRFRVHIHLRTLADYKLQSEDQNKIKKRSKEDKMSHNIGSRSVSLTYWPFSVSDCLQLSTRIILPSPLAYTPSFAFLLLLIYCSCRFIITWMWISGGL